MLRLLGRGDTLATSCVNLAEIEAGLRQRERRKAEAVFGHLRFLVTTPEAAQRAGRYQRSGRGRAGGSRPRTRSLPGSPGPMVPCS
jgi:predicted nucleic acid-binding protein